MPSMCIQEPHAFLRRLRLLIGRRCYFRATCLPYVSIFAGWAQLRTWRSGLPEFRGSSEIPICQNVENDACILVPPMASLIELCSRLICLKLRMPLNPHDKFPIKMACIVSHHSSPTLKLARPCTAFRLFATLMTCLIHNVRTN